MNEERFDTILSLKYTIDENRNHWHPTETAWREKTAEDFIAAMGGILKTKLK